MFILTKSNSVANNFLAELRDAEIQKDRMRFRRNMERLGEIMAYEISKMLSFGPKEIITPLSTSQTFLLEEAPVLATILRAGIPFYQGFLNYFDKSPSAFIAAYRSSEGSHEEIEIKMEYLACPPIEGKNLILIDPMLATGKSVFLTYQSLLKFGKPAQVHIASVIASRHAIAFLQQSFPHFNLWIGDVDEELNNKAYIVPGLGDAGDLAFGDKL